MNWDPQYPNFNQQINPRNTGFSGSYGIPNSMIADQMPNYGNMIAQNDGRTYRRANPAGQSMIDAYNLGQEAYAGEKKPGFISKIANFAAQFKPMGQGGSNIADLFNQGGKMNSMLSGGKLAGIGAAPAWAIPAAAAAGWQINKRLGQKAHQKDLRRYEDQVRNMSTQEQYESGLQKPEHSRHGGMLGRLFRR